MSNVHDGYDHKRQQEKTKSTEWYITWYNAFENTHPQQTWRETT